MVYLNEGTITLGENDFLPIVQDARALQYMDNNHQHMLRIVHQQGKCRAFDSLLQQEVERS